MAIFNGNKEFSKKRELSQPLVPVPKNVRQAFNIQKAYANGVFQLEPKRKETLYDRCYVFEDINYINKNRTEKKNFLSELMFWLNSMDVSYKITLCNEYQSVENVLAHIDEISGKSLKEKLSNNKEQALLSKQLATIFTDVPVDLELSKHELKSMKPEAKTLMKELEFHKKN